MHGHSSQSKSTDILSEIRSRLTVTPALVRKEINVLEWAETLGASATPVREALFQLVGEGLVEIVPQKGFFHVPLTLRSSKSCYSVIQAILEHKLRKSKSLLDFEHEALEELRASFDKHDDMDNSLRSELIRDLYFAFLSGKGDVEARNVIERLYLKTDSLRRRLLIDKDIWRDVISAARLAVECLEKEEFEKAIPAVRHLLACKAGHIEQAFQSLTIEYFAED